MILKLKREIKLLGFRRFLIAVFLIITAIIIFAMRKYGILYSNEEIIFFLKNYQILAPVLFILIYILMIIFLIPTLPMNLGAGFLWGGFLGGAISLVSTSFGAIIAFIISRYIIHDYFNNKFDSRIWQWLKQRIQKNDWKIIAFTRINPIFPFALTSYFFGLMPVSFLKFFIPTVLPVILPAFLFSYLGHSIGGIILGEKNGQILQKIFIIFALITFAALIYFLIKKYFSIKKYNKF